MLQELEIGMAEIFAGGHDRLVTICAATSEIL
jgi:hypothetical protein